MLLLFLYELGKHFAIFVINVAKLMLFLQEMGCCAIFAKKWQSFC
jgi:hypothetical protein